MPGKPGSPGSPRPQLTEASGPSSDLCPGQTSRELRLVPVQAPVGTPCGVRSRPPPTVCPAGPGAVPASPHSPSRQPQGDGGVGRGSRDSLGASRAGFSLTHGGLRTIGTVIQFGELSSGQVGDWSLPLGWRAALQDWGPRASLWLPPPRGPVLSGDAA